MKITADTNVLVRAAVGDDALQSAKAIETLRKATLIAVPTTVLCEFSWVLGSGYKRSKSAIASAIRALIDTPNVRTNISAVEAGLEMMAAGGDFADGVIAQEGTWLGAEEFVSFDKRAVEVLTARGQTARLL